jgi:hypothetical protein
MMPLESALEPIDGDPAAPRGRADESAAGLAARVLLGLKRAPGRLGAACEWLFGLASAMVGLAVLASVPGLQLLSLGYLLESSGRVVRSGRLRSGLVGLRPAARLGSVALGTWLVLWPARAVAGLWYSSWLLNGPAAGATRAWWWAGLAASGLTIVHIFWAWARGGRLRHFLWPAPVRLLRRLRAGGFYVELRDRFWDFVAQLQLARLFWIGLRGAAGAMIWLVVPVTLLMLASRMPAPAGVFSGLIGGLVLATVLLYLPFLQARFGASGQWRDLFDVRAVRRDHRHAPIAFWM